MSSSFFRQLGIFLFVFLGYIIAGKLGLRLAFINDSATAIWAPTGIALAAFLILGYRVWPVILLGAFVVNLSTTNELYSSFGIAIGNTLEGLVGAYLVNRYASGRNAFFRTNDIWKFALFAGIIATAISATIGSISLLITKLATMQQIGSIWFTWWLGDSVGAIALTPALILIAEGNYRRLTQRKIYEVGAFMISLVGINLIIFGNIIPNLSNGPIEFLLIPFLVYSAFRFSRRETSVIVLIIASIAIWGTLHGMGPFAGSSVNQSLLTLQAFIAVVALTTFVLSSTILENEQNQEKILEAYNTALEGWSKALDIRDQETEGHTRRVTELSMKLARAMGIKDEELIQIRRGALLHDIGKIYIPDSILFKKGPLSDTEWQTMMTHPAAAYNLLKSTALKDSLEIPYCHHEKWDGSGYPRGLKGKEIPLCARIFAVADVCDALRSDRPYRAAVPEAEVFEILISQSGKHFDPEILEVFIRIMRDDREVLRVMPESNTMIAVG